MHKPIIVPFLFTLCIGLGLFTGCELEEELDTTSREDFIISLAQDWTVDEDSYILIDNQDVTHLISGFEMIIDEDLNFVTNSDQLSLEEFPWPAAGSFALNEQMTELTRDDGLVITLVSNEEVNSLEFEFLADENTTGRTLGIIGRWKCKFRKKR